MTLSSLYRVHRWRDDCIIKREHKGRIRHGKKDDNTRIKIEHTCSEDPMIIKRNAGRTIDGASDVGRSGLPSGLRGLNRIPFW